MTQIELPPAPYLWDKKPLKHPRIQRGSGIWSEITLKIDIKDF
jgi:hypothetical protein